MKSNVKIFPDFFFNVSNSNIYNPAKMATASSGSKSPNTGEETSNKSPNMSLNQTSNQPEKTTAELLQLSMEEFYRDRPILFSNLPASANEVSEKENGLSVRQYGIFAYKIRSTVIIFVYALRNTHE